MMMERYASLTNYTRSEIDIEALIKNCYLCKLHRTFFDCSLLRLLAAIFSRPGVRVLAHFIFCGYIDPQKKVLPCIWMHIKVYPHKI